MNFKDSYVAYQNAGCRFLSGGLPFKVGVADTSLRKYRIYKYALARLLGNKIKPTKGLGWRCSWRTMITPELEKLIQVQSQHRGGD